MTNIPFHLLTKEEQEAPFDEKDTFKSQTALRLQGEDETSTPSPHEDAGSDETKTSPSPLPKQKSEILETESSLSSRAGLPQRSRYFRNESLEVDPTVLEGATRKPLHPMGGSAVAAVAPSIYMEPLFDEIEEALNTYTVFRSDHEARLLTLWVAHTYAAEQAHTTPYLFIRSATPSCGKTNLLDMLVDLAHNARRIDNVSTAALFRRIAAENGRVVVLLDEIQDHYLNDDIRGLLNSGYKRGGTYERCHPKTLEPEAFETFSPKVIAGMNTMPARWKSVETRSIEITLRPALPGEKYEEYDSLDFEDIAPPITERLQAWSETTKLPRRQTTTVEGLRGRNLELWRSLLIIAEHAGPRWTQYAVEACRALTLNKRASIQEDYGPLVLGDIREIWPADEEAVHSRKLVELLRDMEERPWMNMYGKEALDQDSLAKLLRPFEIISSQIKVNGVNKRGYRLVDFEDNWERFLAADDDASRGRYSRYRATAQVRGGKMVAPSNEVGATSASEDAVLLFDAETERIAGPS